jgi:VanZ family protein
MRRFLTHWLPPLLWMALIFLVSAQSDLPGPELPESLLKVLTRKSGHLLAYGCLAWLYWRALAQALPGSPLTSILSFALAVLYGVTDEYHQMFVPGREGKLTDVLIDGLGAGVTLLVTPLVIQWLARRRALPPQAV